MIITYSDKSNIAPFYNAKNIKAKKIHISKTFPLRKLYRSTHIENLSLLPMQDG